MKHPWILARATVIFLEVVETKGWKVLRSTKRHPRFQEELWFQAPSFPRGTKNGKPDWEETVWVADRRLYEEIEEKLYNSYRSARDKEEGKDGAIEAMNQSEEIDIPENLEDVNPDDIPL